MSTAREHPREAFWFSAVGSPEEIALNNQRIFIINELLSFWP